MVLGGCQQRNAEDNARRSLARAGREITPADAVAAAREGRLQEIILFREAGLDLSQADSQGETPLLAALRAGHMDVADNLLRGGVPAQALPAPPAASTVQTTAPDPGPPTPAAVQPSGPPVVPEAGQTALGWALARRDLNILGLLLQNGADPNEPLLTPASADFVQAVAHEGFAYYLRREKNVTPLMLAAATGQIEAVRALLAAGARPGAQTARHKTVAIWLAGTHGHPSIVQVLLGKSPRPEDQHTRLKIKLGEQKVLLYKNGEIADSSPISSGRKGFATPTGMFVVTNKYRHWKSTLYDDAPMPYFMRLSCSDFGLHAGVLPGYPASHGCIRLPETKAAAFFAKVDVGTLVEIVD
jgi:lipoprotein-anchoring transpeptidase ErfK/SrfK